MKNIRTILFVLLAILCFGPHVFAQNESMTEDSIFILSPDDPVAAMLDSLEQMGIFEYKKENIKKNQHKFSFPQDSVPTYASSVYEERLSILNSRSPFQLDYNEVVKAYIDLYGFRKREQVSRMLSLTELYFPMFEEKLDKHDLPLELKYLAVVESALNVNAKSRAGAMGLWQFMYGTGKMFGLEVNSFVDERCDPDKSTDAACAYFKYLYKMYGDWQLVLAAYNAGPGTVNKAIRRSGGKTNYWELRPFLPLETRSYVPAFIAVNYIMNYTKEHNLYPSGKTIHHFQIDTVKVKHPLNFVQIANLLKIPIEEIQFLNPTYKKDIIPCIQGEFNTLCLTKPMIASFIVNEPALYSFAVKTKETTDEFVVKQQVKRTHLVKRGETLTNISKRYNCTVSQLKEWNRLKSNSLQSNQRLIVYTEENIKSTVTAGKVSSAPAPSSSVKKEAGNKSPQYIYHVVQPGDSLWKIANKYDGVTIDEIKELNNISNTKNLKVGAKLKVAIAG